MTREEIAQYIKTELANDDTEIYLDIDDYKIIVKALEQEPILDEIKAEIEAEYGNCDICEWYEDYDYEDNNISEYERVGAISDILEIIDKYKNR